MSVLRSCSPALATALASGEKLWRADLFQFTLIDGVTNFFWTSWDNPNGLLFNGTTYKSMAPWLTRSKWNVTNTMEVPSLDVFIDVNANAFNGGLSLQAQVGNGLFDGATMLLSRVYMAAPGATSTLGAIALFGGVTGQAVIIDNKITLTCKGKNNLLDQMAPRNVYQLGCLHAFCDVNCTLSAASFTTNFTVGSSPTTIFIPWPSTPPANAANYTNGVINFTSGVCAGESRSISLGNSSGLFLAYPLYEVPTAGDAFTAFQGCDKTFNSGSGQSCNDRSNTQNFRGFDFVPPPDTTY